MRYLGFNYRMTDFQTCLTYNQLSRYAKRLKLRIKNAKLYFELLRNNNLILKENKFPLNCSFFYIKLF